MSLDLRKLIRENLVHDGGMRLLELKRDLPREFCLFAFLPSAAKPSFVIKGSVSKTRAAELSVEAENLRLLNGLPWKAHGGAVPRAVFDWRKGDTFVFAQTCLDGRRLKNMDLAKAYSPEGLQRLFFRVADWLVDFHQASGASPERSMEPSLDELVDRPLVEFRDRFSITGDVDRMLRQARENLHSASREGVPIKGVRLHGDLSTANVLVDGDTLRVIDWELPMACRLPMVDLVHFMASCRIVRGNGSSREELYRRNYDALFFEPGRFSAPCLATVDRYLGAQEIPRGLAMPLAVMAWVVLANDKARWLEKRGKPGAGTQGADLNADFPVTFFSRGSVMNLEVMAEERGRFILR